MEKTGTLPQKRRVTRKTIVENAAQENHQKIAISHDERHRMIAEAAHFRAEKRAAADNGDHLDDWLAAEAEIDAMLDEVLANLALSE